MNTMMTFAEARKKYMEDKAAASSSKAEYTAGSTNADSNTSGGMLSFKDAYTRRMNRSTTGTINQNTWNYAMNQYNNILTGYQNLYKDYGEKYSNGYMKIGDTEFNDYAQKKDSIVRAINTLDVDLGRFKGAVPQETLDAISGNLTKMRDGFDPLSEYVKNGTDYYSQFKDSDEYNKYLDDAEQRKILEQYSGYSYDELKKIQQDVQNEQDIDPTEDKEKILRALGNQWYTTGYSTIEDYDKAIADADAEVQRLTALDKSNRENTPLKYSFSRYDPTQNKPQDASAYKNLASTQSDLNTAKERKAYLESQKRLKENEIAVQEKYGDTPKNSDFAERSRVNDSVQDLQYQAVNGKLDPSLSFRTGAQNIGGHSESAFALMDDDERKLYNYIFSTEGSHAAGKYLDLINIDKRAADLSEKTIRANIENGGFGTSAFYSAVTPVINTFTAIPSFIVNAGQAIAGESNPYSTMNTLRGTSNVIRSAVSDKIKDSVDGFGGKALSEVYNAGMSVADNLLGVAVTGGANAPKIVGALGAYDFVMGMGAASDTLVEAKKRGLSDGQAVATALGAGVAETLFEHASLENLKSLAASGKKTFGTYVMNFLKQSFTEGSEEFFTDIANAAWDSWVNGGGAELEQKRLGYIMEGMSVDEAEAKVAKDFGEQVGESFLLGAMSGGMMSVGASAVGDYRYRSGYDNGAALIENGEVQGLRDAVSNADKNSAAYKFAQKLSGVQTEDLSPTQVGRLYNKYQQSIRNDAVGTVSAQINDRLSELGVPEKRMKAVSKAVTDAYVNGKTSVLQNVTLNKKEINAAQTVVAELSKQGGIKDFASKAVESATGKQETAQPEFVQKSQEAVTQYRQKSDVAARMASIPIVEATDADGNKVSIGQFTRVDGENSAVQTESGETTLSALNLENEGAAALYSAVAKTATSTYEANAMLRHYNGQNVQQYVNSFNRMVTAGAYATSDMTAAQAVEKYAGFADIVGTDAAKAAFNVGKHVQNVRNQNAASVQQRANATAEETQLLQEAAANMSSDESARFMDNYVSGMDVKDYADAWNHFADVGKKGLPFSNAVDGVNESDITAKQARAAYDAGVRAAKNQTRTLQEAWMDRKLAKTESGSIVVRKGSVENNTNQTNLSEKQKSAVQFVRQMSKLTGLDFVLFQSDYTGMNGKYLNGKIWLDLNSGSIGEQAVLRTLGHELTHFIQEFSPAQYEEFRAFLFDELNHYDDTTVQRLMVQQIENAKKNNVRLTEAQALDEVVADACEMMLQDGSAIKKLAQSNLSTKEKIIAKINDLLNLIAKAFEGVTGTSNEYAELREAKANFAELQRRWNAALADATETFNGAQGAQNAENAKNSMRKSEQTITQEDITAIQNIPRKSVSQFTAAEIKATEKWARLFYEELKEKSPYFRAWFGDWRAYDTGKVKKVKVSSVNLENALATMQRGIMKNVDSDWNINVGSVGLRDTVSHSGREKISAKMLSEVKQIIENAVLLDTEPSQRSSNKKHIQTAWMHKFYSYVEYNGDPYIAKISVEEYGTSENADRRFYNLRGIKIEPVGGAPDAHTSYGTMPDTDSTTISVSDMFALVKQFDKDFSSNPVNPALLNEDGTPKVVYHGTNADFTVFNSKDGTYWFSESEDYAEAMMEERGGGKVMPVYLQMKNPMVAKLEPTQFTNPVYEAPLIRQAKENGYDGLIIENNTDTSDLAYDKFFVVFSPNQIKSATDNIGTFDGSNPDIRYSTRKPTKTARQILSEVFSEQSEQYQAYASELKAYQNTLDKLNRTNARLEELRTEEKTLRNAKPSAAQPSVKTEPSEKMWAGYESAAREDTPNLKELNAVLSKSKPETVLKQSLVDTVARKLAKSAGIKNSTQLSEKLMDYYKWLSNGTDIAWDGVSERAREIADWMVEQRSGMTARNEEYAPILADLKGTSVFLDDTMKSEIQYDSGNLSAFKKSIGSVVKLTDNPSALRIDVLWGEMAEKYAWAFDPEITNTNEMVLQLKEIIDAARTPVQIEFDMDAMARDVAADVYDGFWDIATVKSPDVKHREQIAKLRAAHAKKTAALKQKYQSTISQLKNRQKQKSAAVKSLQQNLNKQATARDDIARYESRLTEMETTKLKKVLDAERRAAVEAMRKKGRQDLQQYREDRRATELRRKINRAYQEFMTQMRNPNKHRYIPQYLAPVMQNLLETLNLGGAQDTKKQQTLAQQLAELRDRYADLKTDNDPDFQSEYDSYLRDQIDDLAEIAKDKTVADMSLGDLERVYRVIRAVQKTLVDAKKLISSRDRASVKQTADKIVVEQRNVQIRRSDKKIAKFLSPVSDFVQGQSLSAMRNVERISGYDRSSALYKLFEDINDGVQKKNMFVMETEKKFADLINQKEEYNKAVGEKLKTNLVDDNGHEVYMTKMQIMQTVMSWEREQANPGMKHLTTGGIKVLDYDLVKKGKSRAAEMSAVRVGISEHSMAHLKQMVSDSYSKEFMKTAHEFFDVDAKARINETMLRLKHYTVANDKSYIPFKVDKTHVVQEIDGTNQMPALIENAGILKEKSQNATQPIIIEGLNDVISEHKDTVGKIYGLAIPVRNFNKVWNAKSEKLTVKESVGQVWNKYGIDLIQQAVQDVQRSRTRSNNALDVSVAKVSSNFASAVLNFNVSVAMKQAASLQTAYLYLKHRNIVTSTAEFARTCKNYQSIIDEIDAHTAQHYMRRIGLSTQELGDIATGLSKTSQIIKKIPTGINPTKWIQGIDCLTTAAFWNMCKEDIQAQNPGIDVKSDTYWQKVTDLYDLVIEETQPMYDVLHRPEVQKATGISRYLVMFKTQPLQNAGIIWNTYGEMHTAKKSGDADAYTAAKKKFAKAVASQVESAVVFAVMTLVGRLLLGKLDRYKDDDDEATVWSFSNRILLDTLNSLAGVFLPPWGADLETTIENAMSGGWFSDDMFTVEALDQVNGLISNTRKVFDDPSMKNVSKLIFSGTTLLGLPAQNAWNLVNGIITNTRSIYRLASGTDADSGVKINESVRSEIQSQVNAEAAKRKKKFPGETDEELQKGAAATVKSKITTAQKKRYLSYYLAKNQSGMEDVVQYLASTGLYSDVNKTVSGWVESYLDENRRKGNSVGR